MLRALGPHAPGTVRRRLASWSTLTEWRGLEAPFTSPALKSAIRLAVRAVPRVRKRKSDKAVTGDILGQMLATCAGDNLRDSRDRAILMLGFASGGRRRSEIASLRVALSSWRRRRRLRSRAALPFPRLLFTSPARKRRALMRVKSSISPAAQWMR